MTENRTSSCPIPCPKSCPCPVILDIANSISHMEDALACILNAECAKISKTVEEHSDLESFLAIDTSAQETLEQISRLEGILKAKLDAILPLLSDCM